MLLYSKTLGKEINFATFEKEENGKPIRIIFHDALENALHDLQVKYFYDFISSDVNHSVVTCTIVDANGRRIVGIGETIPETLTTEIARQYPSLIATQRAFDRAVIRYLGLDGKVFSNMEIPVIEDDITTPTEQEGIVSAVVEDETDTVDLGNYGDEDIGNIVIDGMSESLNDADELFMDENNSDTIHTEAEDAADVPNAPEAPEVPELSESDSDIDIDIDSAILMEVEEEEKENYGDYVITMKGKYSGKGKTIAEIYATDASWMQWIAEKFNPGNPVAKRDVEAIRAFLSNK